jgi:alginate O-acetyltransferase complex protein AlgJ
MSTPKTSKFETLAKGTMIALFVGALWLPMLDKLLHLDHTAHVDENRALSPFPQAQQGLSSVREFVSALEKYHDDHFGFRKRLIYWAQHWKSRFLQDSSRSHVIIGKEGWLYAADPPSPLGEDPRLTTPFSLSQMHAWQTLFESRQKWLSQRGMHYLVVLVPRKQSVYPEYLPPWIRSAEKIDQFVAYMRTNSAVEVIELRSALLEAKRVKPTYHLTDSHWNDFGAFHGYHHIVVSLSNALPTLKPLSLDAFDVRTNFSVGGDLARRLAQVHTLHERQLISLKPRPPLPFLRATQLNLPWAFIKQIDNPGQSGKVLVFGDSFSYDLLPFLGQHFSQTIMYRLCDRGRANDSEYAHVWKSQLIEQHRPDLVIDEILENLFVIEDPQAIKREDALD